MNLRIIERELIKLHSLPKNFAFYRWEIVQDKPLITRLDGGLCCERLKKKDYLTILRDRDWKRRDKKQDRTFYVTSEQAEQFEREYVEQTGCCPNCEGRKVELKSCGVLRSTFDSDGEGSYTTYRTCSKCNGSGRALTGATP